MEDIITLVVFVIIITVSSIFSKLKGKQKKQPGAAPLSGWVAKLNAFLLLIERQIQQRSTDRTTDAYGPDQLLEDGETFSSTYDVDEDNIDDRMFEEEETEPGLKKIVPAAPVRAHTSQSDRTQFVPDAPQRLALHASRANLRKAVIWSEILGPPVALRNEHSGKGGHHNY